MRLVHALAGTRNEVHGSRFMDFTYLCSLRKKRTCERCFCLDSLSEHELHLAVSVKTSTTCRMFAAKPPVIVKCVYLFL